MKFKTPQIEQDWKIMWMPAKLRAHSAMLDTYITALTGSEMTVTSFLRDIGTQPSYHPLGRAYDIRTHDWNSQILSKIVHVSQLLATVLNRNLDEEDGQIQIDPHSSWNNSDHPLFKQRHKHIECDDGNPAFIKEEV